MDIIQKIKDALGIVQSEHTVLSKDEAEKTYQENADKREVVDVNGI